MKPTCSVWLLAAALLSQPAMAEDTLLAQANAETEASGPEVLSDARAARAEKPSAPGVLTLQEAIDKALENTPRLKSAHAARGSSLGLRSQAGVLPNPEAWVQADNISGRGPYRGFNSSEIAAGVSQVIELGGKRSRRQQVAEQDLRLSDYALESERLDVIRDVTLAYIGVIAAQEEMRLTSEQKALAEDLLKEVGERVSAAREPLLQRSKAEITTSTSRFAHSRAVRELNHARHMLASLWGGHHEIYTLDTQSFFTLTDPETEAQIESALEANPTTKRWEAVKARSAAQMELEKAQSVPDPRLSFGVRDFRASDSQALVAGVSIPIPVFNSNRGNIESARAQMAKAESDEAANRLSMRNTAYEYYEAMVNAYQQAKTLRKSTVPAAEKAFRLSREGYRMGRFAYLEVLDSQRTLFEARAQYIGTLRDYHKARAETDRLTAAHVAQSDTQGDHHAN